jgi:hypothetical protein
MRGGALEPIGYPSYGVNEIAPRPRDFEADVPDHGMAHQQDNDDGQTQTKATVISGLGRLLRSVLFVLTGGFASPACLHRRHETEVACGV